MEQKMPVITVLVVDDEPQNIQLISSVLKEHSYQVLAVTSGRQAVEVAVKRKPDIILLDIMMPEYDGFEVCSQLRKDDQAGSIPIIFLTGKTDQDSIRKAKELKVAGYIAKPFRAEDLVKRISKVLRNRKRADLNEVLAEKRALEAELIRSRQEVKLLKVQNLQTERKIVIAQIEAVARSMEVVFPLLGKCQNSIALMTKFVAREILSDPKEIVNLEIASQACLVGFQGCTETVLIADTIGKHDRYGDVDRNRSSWELSYQFFKEIGLLEAGRLLKHDIMKAVSDYCFLVHGWPKVFTSTDKIRKVAKDLLGAEGEIGKEVYSLDEIVKLIGKPFIRRQIYPIQIAGAILEFLEVEESGGHKGPVEWINVHSLESGRRLARDLVDKRGEFSLKAGTLLDDGKIKSIIKGFREFHKIALVPE